MQKKLSIVAATAVVISIGLIVFAVAIVITNRLYSSQTSSVASRVATAHSDLSDRLKTLAQIKEIEISGEDEFSVSVTLQSSSKNPQGELTDVLQKAMVERELQLNYWIGQPVRAYTITIVDPSNGLLFLGSRLLSSDEPSQRLLRPTTKLLDDEKMSKIVQDELPFTQLKLKDVTTSKKSFAGIEQQLVELIMTTKNIDELNSTLPSLVTSLPVLIDKVNAEPNGQIAIFTLQVKDSDDHQLYLQVWDQDLRSGFIQAAEGVRRFSSNGEIKGPVPTPHPDDFRISTSVP